jgi:Domain of unknown function (DUF4386)
MVIGGLLMPYAAKPTSNVQEMLKPLGEHEFRAQVSSLLMIMGIWAMMIGATAVYRSITTGGAAWARLGFYFILVGTAVWTVTLSQDVATASAAANWLAAPAAGKEAAYSAVAAVNAVSRGLYPMTIIVYWLAYTFLGIAMVLSNVYPRWLGWVGLILGITGVAVGIIQNFTARSTTFTLIFAVLSLLTTLWALVVGIWVARKAWWRTIIHSSGPDWSVLS